jgi:hypothetical protein
MPSRRNNHFVMRGLDPRIHRFARFFLLDGLPGQAGNDEMTATSA